jgi:hypothetical protein
MWASAQPADRISYDGGCTDSSGSKPAIGERHCVVRIDPVKPGQSASRVYDLRCFATFAQAITAATGGRVHLPANTSPAQLTDQVLSPQGVTAAPFVIGIDYKDWFYGGTSVTWQSDSSGCTSGLWFWSNTMPAGFDNQLSSTRAFSNCNHNTNWENTGQTGAEVICTPDCSYVGDTMNDRISSKTWKI